MFDFSIDHAAFMATLETIWDTININGMVGLVLNGLFVLACFRLFSLIKFHRIDG